MDEILENSKKMKFIKDLVTGEKSEQEVSEVYKKWAAQYDSDLSEISYEGPNAVAREISHHIKADQNSLILDLGAGTGLVGEKLSQLGYSNLHALDASQSMLDVANAKNIYSKTICSFVYDSPTSGMRESNYDLLVTVGSFTGNHLKPNVLKETCRLVKPDGYIVIAMSQQLQPEYMNEMESNLTQLSKAGVCREMRRTPIEGYAGKDDGFLIVIRVLK